MKVSPIFGISVLVILVAGCHGRVVIREPHSMPPPPAEAVIYEEVEVGEAPTAPPAMIVEVRPAPPQANMAWIDGNWVYSAHGWRWSKGHYVHPHAGGNVYVGGHWDHRGGHYVWVGGHWK